MRGPSGALVVAALACAVPRWALAQVAAPVDEGSCSVRVASVAPAGENARLQAVVLEPTVRGSATLSGSVALFTVTDVRYVLRFENLALSSDAPGSIVYRFPQPVAITGAYVASLDTPSPGPCSIVAPWRPGETLDAPTEATLRATMPAAIAVTDPGTADPLFCRYPNAPPRIVKMSPPLVRFLGPGGLPQGEIDIRVVVDPTGKPVDAEIERVDGDIDASLKRTEIRSAALDAAKDATYAPATFRCRRIVGVATYQLKLEKK